MHFETLVRRKANVKLGRKANEKLDGVNYALCIMNYELLKRFSI